MEWLVSNWQAALTGLLIVLGGLQAAALVIAPLTETKLDDKLAGYLSRAYNLFAYFSPKRK